MTNTAIVPTNNIQGDITSCKIETSEVLVEKNSVFSFTQEVHYRSYDVCTKEVVNDYQVPEFTFWPFILICALLFIFIVSAMSSDTY